MPATSSTPVAASPRLVAVSVKVSGCPTVAGSGAEVKVRPRSGVAAAGRRGDAEHAQDQPTDRPPAHRRQRTFRRTR